MKKRRFGWYIEKDLHFKRIGDIVIKITDYDETRRVGVSPLFVRVKGILIQEGSELYGKERL